MSYQSLRGDARKAMLKAAKHQYFRKKFDMSEDNRPVISAGMTMKCLYDQLNRELFDNDLPDIPVVFNSRLTRTLGLAYYRYDSGAVVVPVKIEIRKKHRWTNRFLRKVMIHEMCHIWAYHFHNEDKGGENGHGPKFWAKMNELGYPKTHDWDDSEEHEKDIWC
jgi:predicted SprT family Zn-dependent metalloprotease